MAATVTSSLIVTLRSILANSVGQSAAQASIETGINQALASGIGSNQCDRVYSENDKSLAGAYDLDLSGSLVDALGAACVFAKIKAIVLAADAANTGDVIVGGDANAFMFLNLAASTLTIKPGGVFVLFAPAGYTVTAATGDILQFAPSAGTQLVDIAILGTSV